MTKVSSGGEAALLLFGEIMVEKPNVLVLDEPEKRLEFKSINALNIALQRYKGTLFMLTHDYKLFEEVTSRVGTPKLARWETQGYIRRVREKDLPKFDDNLAQSTGLNQQMRGVDVLN